MADSSASRRHHRRHRSGSRKRRSSTEKLHFDEEFTFDALRRLAGRHKKLATALLVACTALASMYLFMHLIAPGE